MYILGQDVKSSNSVKVRKILTEVVARKQVVKCQLRQKVSSHWNSTYPMLEQLLEQREPQHTYVYKDRPGRYYTGIHLLESILATFLISLLGSHCWWHLGVRYSQISDACTSSL